MTTENPKTGIVYYGKKAYYLNKEIARKIEPEQNNQKLLHGGVEEDNSILIH